MHFGVFNCGEASATALADWDPANRIFNHKWYPTNGRQGNGDSEQMCLPQYTYCVWTYYRARRLWPLDQDYTSSGNKIHLLLTS